MTMLTNKNALFSRLRIYYFLHYDQSVESNKSNSHHIIFKFSVKAKFFTGTSDWLWNYELFFTKGLYIFSAGIVHAIIKAYDLLTAILNADVCCSPVIISLQLNYGVTNWIK